MIPPFPTAEFAARSAALQRAMAAAGIDALLLTSEPDVRYVTGFLTRFWESPTRPWFVVLPGAGKPVAVIPGIGAELMAGTWIEDIRCWSSPDYGDDGVSLLAAALTEAVPEGGTLGLPMGQESVLRMPLADWERVRAGLGRRRVTDASPLLRAEQEVKSPAEIALIHEICGIAGRAFARVPEIAQPGVTLAEVFRRFQILLLEEGADWVPYLAGAAAPGGYGDVISPAGPRALARGDVLMLDTGAVRAGYFCDFDRNWALGPATPEVAGAHDLLFDAVEAGFAAARPGALASDLWAAMDVVIARRGEAGAGGRLGHGLGMRLTEGASLIPADRTELRPGMVLTLEPGLQIAPGRMLVAEEVIAITETGADWLSPRAPREIPELPWPAMG